MMRPSPARHPFAWLQTRDRDLAVLRRAGRAAIVMPAMFAIGDKVLANPTIATFAAFGSFALLLLVDFPGRIVDRLQSQLLLCVAGAALIALATVASQTSWSAAIAMALVAFGVLFAGVVSSVLAGAGPALLLAFVLPVATRAPIGQIPDRLAGWALASGASLLAISVLWPAPTRDPLRQRAAATCRALAARLEADIAYRLGEIGSDEHLDAIVAADAAVSALHTSFLATPYRPTGLSTPARLVVRLVDELNWLNRVVVKTYPHAPGAPVNQPALAVKRSAAQALRHSADLLENPRADSATLQGDLARLRADLVAVEDGATATLPVRRVAVATAGAGGADEIETTEIVSSLEPSFRVQELSFAVGQIATNVAAAAAADRRGWLDRVLGHQPDGVAGSLASARERAGAHVERHSVWLHNSVRGAVGLGAAIFVSNATGVQHSFWVVLGTLSVLRSNALNTGQNVLRGLIGTTAGVVIGALLLQAIGTSTNVLWALLPLAVLIAGVAPAVISFAAGQAAFTLALVILFNIIAPTGWKVGLIRVEDIAIGCAVSLAVGLLFWPRGAAAALGVALAEAYRDSAAYFAAAVEFGIGRCDASMAVKRGEPAPEALRAAAAARRLDDAGRNYLGERGAKPVPMAEFATLITGVAALRLAADAVLQMWTHDDTHDGADRSAATAELRAAAEAVRQWFDGFATALTGVGAVPDPVARDEAADGRLIDAVRRDLSTADGRASATAVRVIWTGDHIDAMRHLQRGLIGPARAAVVEGGLASGDASHRPLYRLIVPELSWRWRTA